MTERTLSIGLTADTDPIKNPYWLHMEIKKDPLQDGMTIAEAASVIDAVYNIKACEPVETQQNDIWQQEDEGSNRDVWTDDQEATTSSTEDLAAQRRFADSLSAYTTRCDADDLADLVGYDATLKVFRSHRDELYKLQMVNGTADAAVKMSGRVVHTIDIDGESSHTFNNPILTIPGTKPPVIVWQGLDGPEIHILGNTVYWNGAIKATLRAEFDTEWDEVLIHVTGEFGDSAIIEGTDSSVFGTGWYSGSESGDEIEDYQSVECSVLAFYHYQYEELVLERPEEDESTTETEKINICSYIVRMGEDDGGDPGDPDPNAKCQQHVLETVVCECDGKTESNSYYKPVACPAGVSDGSTLQGSQDRRTYADCGFRDKVNDPAFYEETCCEPWPFTGVKERPMPKCETIIKAFQAKPKDEDEEKALKNQYPEGTKFVTVSPADGTCGKWVIKQMINAKNCCDTVSSLVWDAEESIGVITPSSSGEVVVDGGAETLSWKVRGKGFWTDPSFTQRDRTTTSRVLTIYTDATACGSAEIYVTDGCSSVSGSVLSTQGVWFAIDPETAPGNMDATAYIGTSFVTGAAISTFEAYSGKYRARQSYLVGIEIERTTATTIEDACIGNSGDWQAQAAIVRSQHTMLNGEPQLIDPFSGASLLPEEQNPLLYPSRWWEQEDPAWATASNGRGVIKAKSTIVPGSLYYCETAGIVPISKSGISGYTTSNPQAWEWKCEE